MQAIIDALKFSPTVFLMQVVLFIVLWVVMNNLFWKPFMGHLAGRQKSVSDAYKQVEATRHEMEQLRTDYQARITQIEAEARARIQAAIKEAQTERERLLTEAREQSDATLRQGVADMQREKTEALESLRDRMAGLAAAAVGKALGPAADPNALRRAVEERIANQGTGY